jgi:xanthine dehydrogenase YagT iron-sulfur-binding subunit
VDGRRVKSCPSLAALVEGREITTLEGLALGDTLHPLQAALIERDAFQCGYCTPGQCMGGMIGGIGMALMEHSVVDPNNGRVPSANLCEYAVSLQADAPRAMDLIFVEEPRT